MWTHIARICWTFSVNAPAAISHLSLSLLSIHAIVLCAMNMLASICVSMTKNARCPYRGVRISAHIHTRPHTPHTSDSRALLRGLSHPQCPLCSQFACVCLCVCGARAPRTTNAVRTARASARVDIYFTHPCRKRCDEHFPCVRHEPQHRTHVNSRANRVSAGIIAHTLITARAHTHTHSIPCTPHWVYK